MRRDTHKQAEPKATYRVKNWAQYNAGLIARGDVTMWIDEGMCKASAAQARKRGHPLVPRCTTQRRRESESGVVEAAEKQVWSGSPVDGW